MMRRFFPASCFTRSQDMVKRAYVTKQAYSPCASHEQVKSISLRKPMERQPAKRYYSKIYDSPRKLPLEDRAFEHLKELIEQGKHEEIDHVLQALPFNINERDQDGRTLLMHAASNNRLDIIKLLLSRGANPNLLDNLGETAYSLATKIRAEKVESYLANEILNRREAAQDDNVSGPATS